MPDVKVTMRKPWLDNSEYDVEYTMIAPRTLKGKSSNADIR